MIATLLLSVCGALTVFLLAVRWQRKRHDTPVYVWAIPVPGQSPHDQEVECAELAASMYTLKDHDSTRFAAQWDSGLGREFPTLGRN